MKCRLSLLTLITLLFVLASSTTLSAAKAARAAPAAGATVLPQVTSVVAQATADASDFGVARVLCPAGQVVTGGGVDVENVWLMEASSSGPVFPGGPAGTRLINQLNGNGPAPIGWQGSVINNSGVTRTFKAGVLCTTLSEVSSEIGSGSAPSGGFGVARVLCPAGQVAIGGGVDVENVLSMAVSSSGPVFPGGPTGTRLINQPDGSGPAPIGWQGSAINNSGVTRTFKVGVLCAPLPDVSSVIGSGSAASDGFGVERVLCPAGQTAIGGGVDVENVLSMAVSSSGPVFPGGPTGTRLINQPDGFGPAPIGWQGSSVNNSDVTRPFKVGVFCGTVRNTTFLPVAIR